MRRKNIEFRIQSATKRFAGMNVDAISNVSLNFASGKVYAIVGPNGAGKTTLIKIIADLVRVDSGSLAYKESGLPMSRHPTTALALDGGKGFFPRLSVINNFHYFTGISTKDRPSFSTQECYRWLGEFNLAEKAHVECQSLSRGMLQRLALAIAVSTDAELILLDEPTNGLDIVESLSFFRLVRKIAEENGAIIIFCSHQPETILGLADTVSFMSKGKIIGEIQSDQLKSMDQSEFVKYYLNLNDVGSMTEI